MLCVTSGLEVHVYDLESLGHREEPLVRLNLESHARVFNLITDLADERTYLQTKDEIAQKKLKSNAKLVRQDPTFNFHSAQSILYTYTQVGKTTHLLSWSLKSIFRCVGSGTQPV